MASKDPLQKLAQDIVDTFLEGHKKYKPYRLYPEDHSDMIAGARALIAKYEIKERTKTDNS